MLFVFSVLPLPFDIVGIWAGAAHYPLPRFLLYVAAGRMMRLTSVAFLGQIGVLWLRALLS